jgi:NAD(P)H-flavin reductase/ferredoxin
MTYEVTVTGTEISFTCEPGEAVLDAAERAGYALPYSCRKGVCSTCEAGVRTGQVQVRGQGDLTGPAEEVLLCQARPLTDLEIAPKRIDRRGPPDRKTVAAKVQRVTWPAEDVAILQLRLPTGVRARFRAGQYLKVFMADGDSRNYSMANPPHQNDSVQLHIRHVPGGRFSESVLAGMQKGDALRVELPYGEFSLNEESDKPAILIATGTGFAPIKSIVEDQLKRGSERSIHLYWGARKRADLYLAELAEKWAARAPWFSFTPVLSEAEDGWPGRTGWVHASVLDDRPDLSGYEVYACGSPMMTSAAREDFVSRGGLDPDSFHCDAFVPSGDLEPALPQ